MQSTFEEQLKVLGYDLLKELQELKLFQTFDKDKKEKDKEIIIKVKEGITIYLDTFEVRQQSYFRYYKHGFLLMIK